MEHLKIYTYWKLTSNVQKYKEYTLKEYEIMYLLQNGLFATREPTE